MQQNGIRYTEQSLLQQNQTETATSNRINKEEPFQTKKIRFRQKATRIQHKATTKQRTIKIEQRITEKQLKTKESDKKRQYVTQGT